MSVLLDAVQEARELRDVADREFRKALTRASEQHSLREIGRAAGLSFAGVRFILRRERGEIDGYGHRIDGRPREENRT